MSGLISTERLFSLSCFEGLRLFRIYAENHKGLPQAELLELVHQVEADADSLDMQAAVELHAHLDIACQLDGEPFFQSCIKAVVIGHQPIWAKTMRQGRVRFIDSLDSDDRDVFAAAGLLNSPPDIAVVSWWDDVVGHARLAVDIEKMEQARRAETLTIEYEIERLKGLGISKTPEWTGLDDNFAGYDVLSHDLVAGAEVNRMIEVKSTINSPLRFYLSSPDYSSSCLICLAGMVQASEIAYDFGV